MDEHKRKVEDAKDRLRSEVDIELRKYRRRFRVEGEAIIAKLTKDETADFDPEKVAKRALAGAKKALYAEPQKELEAGDVPTP